MKKLLLLITVLIFSISSFAQGKDADDYIPANRIPINQGVTNNQPKFADSGPITHHEVWETAMEGDIFIFSSPVTMLGQNTGNFMHSTDQIENAFILLNGRVQKQIVYLRSAQTANMLRAFYIPQIENGMWVYDRSTNLSIFKYYFPVKLSGIDIDVDEATGKPYFIKRF